jgi:transcriptional regulator with XRE-family HTH domain
MGRAPVAVESRPPFSEIILDSMDTLSTSEAVLDWMDTLPAGRKDSPAPVETHLPLHRLRAVRSNERISRRSLARKLNISAAEVLQQEHPDSDMTLSTLYRWQSALGVPVAELLVEQDEAFSQPVLKRSRMLRLMKTARSIQEVATQSRVRRITQNLIDQLLEIMPELHDVGPWPLVGQRRTLSELGRAAERFFSTAAWPERE